MGPLYDDETIDALRILRDEVSTISDGILLASKPTVEAWIEAVNTRLLPRLMPDFPIVAAICGGGSSGKSTLFNALVGETTSPVAGRAGINRRLLVSVRSSYRHTPEIADALFDLLGCPPQELSDPDQLTTPGDPLLHYGSALPAGLALMDTPDFDTGSQGSYQNREMAEQSLRATDVFIYMFTNANYNNRDNTDFIARMLTTVGTRNCLLVYRAYPGFTEEEVLDHADTVAGNLYGDEADRHVLGVFRAVEDNRVAAGLRPVVVEPVKPGQPGIIETLTQLDPRKIRGELHRSVFSDVILQGQTYLEESGDSKIHLDLYLKALRKIQQQCVQDAMRHLPMDAVIGRFSEIWQDTDPSHVKVMRSTGKVVETPVRLLMQTAKWIRRGRKGSTEPNRRDTAAVMESDFIRAANSLRKASVDRFVHLQLTDSDPKIDSFRESIRQLTGKISVSDQRTDAVTRSFEIPVHPCLEGTQAILRSKNWSNIVDDLLRQQETGPGLTQQLEAELQLLVSEQRSRMTTMDQIRQTAAAMLNIVPATVAVTYVLHTGDPVGATGIKVKLAGLFGLNDLYALVAIPATAGLKKADLKQLEILLAPVAQAWLMHKLTAVEALFEEKITGPLFQKGDEVISDSKERIASMAKSLTHCSRALEKRT